MTQSKILLETGTNEFELIEFIISKRSYGINVAKIREVIELPDEIYPVPKAHPCLVGVTNIRDEIISIIDLKKFLGIEAEDDQRKQKVIITEFNNLKMGFIVDSVTRIYRLSWNKVTSPDKTMSGVDAYITSIVKLQDKIILMLDFEKIVFEVNSFQNMAEGIDIKKDIYRTTHNILVAEDSTMIRNTIVKTLTTAGYKIQEATNGKDALDYFEAHKNELSLVITDIEMPQMDGYSLTKKIKLDANVHLPVVIFSSLISPDIRRKGETVGADAQVTKPELGDLLAIVDDLIFRIYRK